MPNQERPPFSDENINTLWGMLIIDELVKNGVEYFCISPGYRGAPLIHALTNHPRARKMICIDERAAAYHALGYAKGHGKAAALLCTSGTAMANYYPALVEAASDRLPMIVLSADRPSELIGSDANQTIDQSKFYGVFTKDALQLPVPNPTTSPGGWMGKMDRLLFRAHLPPMGPVHINIPFDGPLDPVKSPLSLPADSRLFREGRAIWELSPSVPYEQIHQSLSSFEQEGAMERLLEVLESAPWRLLVIGRLPFALPPDFRDLVRRLARAWDGPIVFDIGSSLKYDDGERALWDFDHPEVQCLLDQWDSSPAVLHLGGPVVSKKYYDWVQSHPGIQLVRVQEDLLQQDSSLTSHLSIIAPQLSAFMERLLEELEARPFSQALSASMKGELEKKRRMVQGKVEALPYSYLGVADLVSSMIPDGDILYLGNSTPIRAFEAVGWGKNKRVDVAVNRGVSGIEGLLASATGLVQSSARRVTLVLGDLAFLHDLNSLMFLSPSFSHPLPAPLIVIIVNNFSGGLFSRLGIGQYPETLNPYISTPHHWTFEHAAGLFQIEYKAVGDLPALHAAYGQGLSSPGPTLIEVRVDNEEDNMAFRNFYGAGHIRRIP